VRCDVRWRTFVAALPLLAAVVTLAACSSPKPPPKPTTQRQRDSAIGASGLPGASGIRRAQQVTDSLNAQTARLDSTH
jgi:hypothetical protein